MSTVRIYAPDGEPFDVPEHREADLLLNKGFTRTKLDPNAVPIVQDVPGYRASQQDEWDALQVERDYIAGQEIDFASLMGEEAKPLEVDDERPRTKRPRRRVAE